MGKIFIITVIISVSIYLCYEGRYYILYFISLLKNKLSFEKDLNKLMTKDMIKRNFKNEELNKYIDLLVNKLTEKNCNINNKKDFKIYDDLKRKLIYSRYDIKSITLLVNSIFDYLNLWDRDVKIEVVYKNSKVKTGFAGLYNYNTEKIEIFVDPNYSYENIVSIVAHECMHHYLFKNNIVLKSRIENELITDLALVYLGFSKYLLEGYKEKRRVIYEDENRRLVDTNKVGYLGYLDVKYSLRYMKKIKTNK